MTSGSSDPAAPTAPVGRSDPAATTAPVEGPEWNSRAAAWAEHWGGFADPARPVVLDAAGIGAGTRLLDVGCGSGELCALAAARGAVVSGIDAAAKMVAIARERVPGADLRVGALEQLPWDDATFDAVTGFNAFQFAADVVAALAEAGRVVRPGGAVAICNWGERRELFEVLGPVGDLQPPPATPPPDRPAVGEPGVLERLARRAGLEPRTAGEVDVPYEAPDLPALERAILGGAGMHTAVEHSGADLVHRTIAATAAPFRRPDGSYGFENRFRYLIAGVEPV